MLFKISPHCRDSRHLNKSFPFTDRKMTVHHRGEHTSFPLELSVASVPQHCTHLRTHLILENKFTSSVSGQNLLPPNNYSVNDICVLGTLHIAVYFEFPQYCGTINHLAV